MKMTKEMRDKIVTVLYEKCANGEISIDQREQLIQKANSAFTPEVTTVETESTEEVEEVKVVEEMSPVEKYNKFKSVVYERCSKGEITTEIREELLEKARNAFFTESFIKDSTKKTSEISE